MSRQLAPSEFLTSALNDETLGGQSIYVFPFKTLSDDILDTNNLL